ncbi:hypothetical protein CP967_21690 [Streptomyces nitrosporeus]|uniref:Uncharacterized protein n=1 Tax=Streptomyces nitrosporeus TaxID=28894 RepID=A0A5J6FDY5_9ACTN|nr:hypothetical protein [Streptomyces nitrosporeus]QEU74256.1 hypothetical protein CP967_21690 [Streptomyces nitrosporeus]GGY96894.1 hypothetical protein GCM10010327_29440 [Streptomyces nitrosporeus]
MPRLTAAQLSYGSATVILSALAMLLLSGVESGAGVAVIGTAALALGVLVAVTVPGRAEAAPRTAAPALTGALPETPRGDGESTRRARVDEHSLRR